MVDHSLQELSLQKPTESTSLISAGLVQWNFPMDFAFGAFLRSKKFQIHSEGTFFKNRNVPMCEREDLTHIHTQKWGWWNAIFHGDAFTG